MFDEQQVARVLDLHEKSYALLRWVNASLRSGRLTFTTVHGTSDSAAAAQEWIGRHLANIPDDARPHQSDVTVFARLFTSFLTTSFQIRWAGCGGKHDDDVHVGYFGRKCALGGAPKENDAQRRISAR